MNTAIKKRRAGLGIQGRLMASFALILVLAGISSAVSWVSFGSNRDLVADITTNSLPSIIRQMELATNGVGLAAQAPVLAASRDAEELAATEARLDQLVANARARLQEITEANPDSIIIDLAARNVGAGEGEREGANAPAVADGTESTGGSEAQSADAQTTAPEPELVDAISILREHLDNIVTGREHLHELTTRRLEIEKLRGDLTLDSRKAWRDHRLFTADCRNPRQCEPCLWHADRRHRRARGRGHG